jgi:hypothetical protein
MTAERTQKTRDMHVTGSPPSLAMLNFLGWVAERPRSYGEAMEAWRSSCPRLSVWEDAIADGLIQVEATPGGAATAHVTLTPRGRRTLS